jgi:hypothetical protein
MDNKSIWLSENLIQLRIFATENKDRHGFVRVKVGNQPEFVEGQFDKSQFQDTEDNPIAPDGVKIFESFWAYYEILFDKDVLRFKTLLLSESLNKLIFPLKLNGEFEKIIVSAIHECSIISFYPHI